MTKSAQTPKKPPTTQKPPKARDSQIADDQIDQVAGGAIDVTEAAKRGRRR